MRITKKGNSLNHGLIRPFLSQWSQLEITVAVNQADILDGAESRNLVLQGKMETMGGT